MNRRSPAVRLALPALAATLLFVALDTTPTQGQWPFGTEVLETYHNLAHPARISPMSGMIRDYDDACVYCHTPHGSNSMRPLWNRILPSGPYRMYEGDIDMAVDPQPTGTSRLCLSCHDGTRGLDVIINRPLGAANPRGENIKRCATDCHTGGNPDGGLNWENVWFEEDMRKQHPISILYDPTADPNFRSISQVEAAGLKLENGKVQCNTCHEPHSQLNPPFMRVSNTGNNFCDLCHIGGTGESTAHFW